MAAVPAAYGVEGHEPGKPSKHGVSEGEGSVVNPKDDEPKAKRGAFQCRFCKHSFEKSQALARHMNSHRTDREKETLQKAQAWLNKRQPGSQEVSLSLSWSHPPGLTQVNMVVPGSSPIRSFRYSSNNLQQNSANLHCNQDTNKNSNAPRVATTLKNEISISIHIN